MTTFFRVANCVNVQGHLPLSRSPLFQSNDVLHQWGDILFRQLYRKLCFVYWKTKSELAKIISAALSVAEIPRTCCSGCPGRSRRVSVSFRRCHRRVSAGQQAEIILARYRNILRLWFV